MPAVDLTGWPIWLVAALLILNLFRDQIGSFIPVALRDHFRSRERQRTIEFEALTEQQRDEREARQRSEAEALHSLLQLNEKLVQHLMQMSNGRADSLAQSLTSVNHKLARLEDMMTFVVKDWSKLSEILDDIDQELEELKSRVK